MADDRIKNYSLGLTGLLLDPHHLLPGVSSEGLAVAENATHDPKGGFGGALRKRPGLARFNNAWAGGVILGGIAMPVAGFGGAPAAGGGAILGTGDSGDGGGIVGDSAGTGDMTGAPGATFDGGAAATTAPGASIFGGGSLFSGARLVVIGKLDATDSNSGGVGWYVGPKSLTSNAVAQATPAQASVYQYPPNATFANSYGKPGCVDNIGTTGLYYAGNPGASQVSGLSWAPTVYRTNGGVNTLVATLARSTQSIANVNGSTKVGLLSFTFVTGGTGYTNGDTITLVGGTGSAAQFQKTANGFVLSAAGNYSVPPTNPVTVSGGTGSGTISAVFGANPIRNAIVDMHYATDGFIYICVKDKYEGQDTSGSAGRAIRLNPTSGETIEWNLGSTDNGGNGVGEAFAHLPYCSCYFDGKLYVGTFPDAQSETASIYASNGSSAVAETAFSHPSSAANYGFLSCMAIYNGRLFVGNGDWHASPAFATLWSRAPGALIQGGVTAWNQQLQASGGAAASGNYFVSLVEFNDALYASWYGNNSNGHIYKLVADDPDDATSTSFTTSTVLSVASPFRLWVDDGVIYAIAEGDSGAPTVYTSPDGTTWTNRTGALPNFGVTARARNIFFGLDQ